MTLYQRWSWLDCWNNDWKLKKKSYELLEDKTQIIVWLLIQKLIRNGELQNLILLLFDYLDLLLSDQKPFVQCLSKSVTRWNDSLFSFSPWLSCLEQQCIFWDNFTAFVSTTVAGNLVENEKISFSIGQKLSQFDYLC